eukprot:scaffold3999_cov138-Skeletonema_dohrnii-CCMP3373.AAC.13
MKGEINRINQTLPTPTIGGIRMTAAIKQWIRSVIRRLNHCKAEHKELLKEATTLLELALWKAKIGEKEKFLGEVKAKKAKMDIQSERNERRVTSGANIVIKNVLPFLELCKCPKIIDTFWETTMEACSIAASSSPRVMNTTRGD